MKTKVIQKVEKKVKVISKDNHGIVEAFIGYSTKPIKLWKTKDKDGEPMYIEFEIWKLIRNIEFRSRYKLNRIIKELQKSLKGEIVVNKELRELLNQETKGKFETKQELDKANVIIANYVKELAQEKIKVKNKLDEVDEIMSQLTKQDKWERIINWFNRGLGAGVIIYILIQVWTRYTGGLGL